MSAERLTRADFARLKSGQNRRFYGRFFTLSVTWPLSENASTEPKFSCVVSKKVAKRAVDRNLIKRRTRDAARSALEGSTTPVSLVFYAKKEALAALYSDIKADVRSLLSQALAV